MTTIQRISKFPGPPTPTQKPSFTGSRTGVLLLHGLGGSPAELYPLTSELRAAGYQVSAPTIEGLACGTDMDSAFTWQDWLANAEAHYDELAEKCGQVHVCGFCGGALLASLLSVSRQKSFGELVMISPTFNGDGWAVPLRFMAYKLVTQRWLARMFTFREREPFGLKDERIRGVVLRMLERTHKPEERIFDISGIKMMEFNRLARKAGKILSDVTARTLVVHAREDDVSSLSNAERVVRKINGPTEMQVLSDCYHVILLDRHRTVAINAVLRFLSSAQQRLTTAIPERRAG
ncbi:MAG: alpha/beta hydrolase [Hyphomicrobiaceae bacterium]